jgi:FAD/FMN-containing dehydrogenase
MALHIESATDPAQYLEDASGQRGAADRAFAPADISSLCEILHEASASGTRVTVAGARTGLTAGAVPQGGWVVSLERFNRLSIRNGSARAGAGVSLRQIQREAAASAQFFPPDPTETLASLGGAINNNASGSRSFRYGPIRQHVLALQVVLMDGRILDVSRGDKVDFPTQVIPLPNTTKHSAGYYLPPDLDWIDLFIGSEGTLGIVTEAEVHLLPAPAALLTGVVFFEHDNAALAAVRAWRSIEGLRMLEYMDAGSLNLLRMKYSEIPLGARAALLVEQELLTQPGETAAQSQAVDFWSDQLTAYSGFDTSWFGSTALDRERFRVFRHALPEEVNKLVRKNGIQKFGTDFAVPIDRNEVILDYYRKRCNESFSGQYVVFGHIGDAHLHVNLLPADKARVTLANELIVDFARMAVALGGTVGAEHGLGKRKAHLLPLLYNAEQIQAMRDVKSHLDPQWLLGRGTLFPFNG